jgi:hypothetical protein
MLYIKCWNTVEAGKTETFFVCHEGMAETGGLCSYWGSTLTALPLGKEPWYPSDRLAGPQSQFGRFAEEMNLLLFPAVKPPYLGPQAVTVGLLTTVSRVPRS